MANTYPEPYRSHRKDSLLDPSTCYNRECVSYVAWKIREATGKWPRRTGDMNAKNWVKRLPENGYKRVSGPKNGGRYAGVLPTGTYGHIVWFEGGTTVSEYNYNYLGNYSVRKINLKSYVWFQIKAPKSPAPKPKPKYPRTVTVTSPANVRKQPNTSASLSGSKRLKKGDKFTSVGLVNGTKVSGNNKWHKSSRGNYVWSGNTNVRK